MFMSRFRLSRIFVLYGHSESNWNDDDTVVLQYFEQIPFCLSFLLCANATKIDLSKIKIVQYKLHRKAPESKHK